MQIYEEGGQIFYWIKLPFVLIGAVVLARTSRRTFVIGTPIVVVALNAALFYGSTRMRVAAEPSLAVLAAMGGVVVAQRLRHRTRNEIEVAS